MNGEKIECCIIPDLAVLILNVPNVNNVSKQTFYYHGIVDWISLPEEIKAVKNAHKYKLLVKKHLLNKQVTDIVQDFIYY